MPDNAPQGLERLPWRVSSRVVRAVLELFVILIGLRDPTIGVTGNLRLKSQTRPRSLKSSTLIVEMCSQVDKGEPGGLELTTEIEAMTYCSLNPTASSDFLDAKMA